MSELQRRVEKHLLETGMSASRFGREAMNDPRLVYDLRAGRRMRNRAEERVRSYIAGATEPYSRPVSRPVWKDGLDDQLWAMTAKGLRRRDIADSLGLSISAVSNRINLLADERLFNRPRYARLADLIARERGLALSVQETSL